MKRQLKSSGKVIFLELALAWMLLSGAQQVQAVQHSPLWKQVTVVQNTYLSLLVRDFSQVEVGKIVFMTEAGGNVDIYSMNYDGSGITRLTTDAAYNGNPSWSPDGTKIAFSSNRSGLFEIYVMNADGSDQVQLTSLNKCFSPQWSPNGTKIAFHCRLENDDIIYTMNPDGTGVFQVTDASISGSDPSWSPDSNRIAFMSSRITPGIYVIDADGNNQALLVEAYGLGYFSWSPVGAQIALSKPSPPNYNFDLYVYDIDSGATTRITETTRNHNSVAWSPEGRFLVFHSNLEDLYNFDIYKIALNGGTIWRLTSNPSGESEPDWVR